MADKVRRIDYVAVHVPDKPGEGARILGALAAAGVSLLSLTAFPEGTGTTQVDFVTDNVEGLTKALKGAGLKPQGAKKALFVQGDDRAGAGADLFRRLAAAGVNVHACNAAAGLKGGYGLILWFNTADFEKAAKALGA